MSDSHEMSSATLSYATDCRHFSGYKPCVHNSVCNRSCAAFSPPSISILIIHLGALGAVVRSTSLLAAIKRKYPFSMITWVTEKPADRLLLGHPLVDRVITTDGSDLLQLKALEFEIGFVIDKSLKAVGLLKMTQVDQVFGFVADPRSGAILPATPPAHELWKLGLDNQQKFFANQKPETHLMIEALELGPFKRDEYFLPLSTTEETERVTRKIEWAQRQDSLVIGFNTGCSDVIAHKKLSVLFQADLILKLQNLKFLLKSDFRIVLLGGPEDHQRNEEIAKLVHERGGEVLLSATKQGLRDGLISVAACDLVVTGDSLGMHMAISQAVYTVAWFGPTCAQEIDLYDRGEKILSPVPCAPCWKRVCAKTQMCYDQVSTTEVLAAIEKGIRFVRAKTHQQFFDESSEFSESPGQLS